MYSGQAIKIIPARPHPLDWWMKGLGYIVQGGPSEGWQKTHPYNHRPLTDEELPLLNLAPEIRIGGDGVGPMWEYVIPNFRLPFLPRGWKKCIVMELDDPDVLDGFLVWRTSQAEAGLSLLPFRRQVRAMVGPHLVSFYAFHADGRPLRLKFLAFRHINDPAYAHVALR